MFITFDAQDLTSRIHSATASSERRPNQYPTPVPRNAAITPRIATITDRSINSASLVYTLTVSIGGNFSPIAFIEWKDFPSIPILKLINGN